MRLNLRILLPQPPKRWDYQQVPLCLAHIRHIYTSLPTEQAESSQGPGEEQCPKPQAKTRLHHVQGEKQWLHLPRESDKDEYNEKGV